MSPPTYSVPPRRFSSTPSFQSLRDRHQNLLRLSRATFHSVNNLRTVSVAEPLIPAIVSIGTMAGATGRSTTSFECSVCLEPLDQPASIDLDGLGDQNPGPSSALTGTGGPVLIDLELNQQMPISGDPRGGGHSSGGGRGRGRPSMHQAANDNNANRIEIVATHCGHIYHQVCLMKWFREEGRRSCPSCRKPVPNPKLTRLYPSSSSNPGTGGFAGNQMDTDSGPDAIAVPIPSTSSGSSGPIPVSFNTNSGCGECRDKTTIHNTLIADYNALQQRYNTMQDNEILMKAQIESFMEDNTRKDDRIAQIQREFSAFRDSVSPPVAPAPPQAEPEAAPLPRRSTRTIVANKRYRRS